MAAGVGVTRRWAWLLSVISGSNDDVRGEFDALRMGLRYSRDPGPLGSGLRRKDGWWWVSGEGWG